MPDATADALKFKLDSTEMLASIKRKEPRLTEEEARALLTMVYWQTTQEFAKQVAMLEREKEALLLSVQAKDLILGNSISRPKDHEIRDIVNCLTVTAREYSATQQLRDRIAQIIVPVLKGSSS
jgi:hypothetical protein